ncbi:antibiotic biosynthesis monooxygenase [Aureimonas flava]|uniref:Antibiotic biosynthesis monooxygenase n=1 Tax=Aureimonas flava TaxID=2320271 RepID=A0A3A1WJ88_9HYPH|nr:putative quinol monooxygenase [Aureimonas flava]RIY00022.1 antibiotic biosynthesis monooxygenase [Aureimonas flava]
MIVVAGSLRLTPEGLAAVRDVARATVTATSAETGCIVYTFAEDLREPGLIRIYEEWESRETLDAHGRAPHMTVWRDALKTVEVKGLELKLIETASVEPFA